MVPLTEGSVPVQAISYKHHWPPPPQPHGPPGRARHSQVHGPVIFTPGLPPEPFPNHFHKIPTQYGYQNAHSRYEEIRSHLASKAYSSSNAELVVVTARMVTKMETRKTPAPVSVSQILHPTFRNLKQPIISEYI